MSRGSASARSRGSDVGIGRALSVPTIRCDRTMTHNIRAIPGYRGFLPAVKAETLGESIFSHVVYDSQHTTKKLAHAEQDHLYTRKLQRDARNWKPSLPPPTVHEYLRDQNNKRGDDDIVTGFVPSAGDYRESRVLNSLEAFYDEPPLENVLKAKTNIVGYQGYVPGREAENVYGNTWTRTNLNATSAFHRTYRGRNRQERSDPIAMDKGKSRLNPRGFYDSQQNRRLKVLFTKDGTAVERLESDDKDEIPMFSSSYQDVRRGWSLDPWVGKQVDPAGREAPFTRQESWGCIPAVKYTRAPGYTGYVPGKVSENVVAERQTTTDYIAKHRSEKNRAEQLQR